MKFPRSNAYQQDYPYSDKGRTSQVAWYESNSQGKNEQDSKKSNEQGIRYPIMRVDVW